VRKGGGHGVLEQFPKFLVDLPVLGVEATPRAEEWALQQILVRHLQDIVSLDKCKRARNYYHCQLIEIFPCLLY